MDDIESPYCANCGSCGEPDCCIKCCFCCGTMEKYLETFDEILEVGHAGGLGCPVYYGRYNREEKFEWEK